MSIGCKDDVLARRYALSQVPEKALQAAADEDGIICWFSDATYWEGVGDDLGTTFLSAGAVLVAVASMDAPNRESLARVTSLPMPFVSLVYSILDKDACCNSAWLHDLKFTLASDRSQVHASFQAALERFWEETIISQITADLTFLRKNCLVGGRSQQWIDPESHSL